MTNVRAVVAAIFALQLLVAPVLATCNNNNVVDPGEQCDGTADSGCPGMCVKCKCPPVKTFNIASQAKPANSPGSPPGVKVTNSNLITQLGKSASLNKARYTRFQLDSKATKPDAILILIPGFEGGANNFRIMAQNLLKRFDAEHHDKRLEVWAFERRTNQLEDTLGLETAEKFLDPQMGINWLFGTELGLTPDKHFPKKHQHAFFYDAQADVPFLANWTNLVFSQDIDAVVNVASKKAKNGNVFLGGHSAGTGFTARYASTDFNLACSGTPQPGYAKLRGLVLLEGTGGTTSGASSITDDSLDRMIAKFDGGLFGAVRDNAPRCVDGTTPCTIATEATDCAGQTPPVCTPPTTSYSIAPALNPQILAQSEPLGIQGVRDPNSGLGITRVDLPLDNPIPGNNAIAKVPEIASLAFIPPGTVEAGFGTFLDKDGVIATTVATFVAMGVGEAGPVVNGLLTWKDILHGPLTPEPNAGPPPTTLTTPIPVWGADKEVTRLDRVLWTFFAGATNFSDWYYPNAGPSTTGVAGVCTSGTCTVGNKGAACAADADCSQAISLDSTRLSIGRGRCDIENLTQAANINIPVITFCGTAGLAKVPGVYTPFGQSIGTCTAPSCDGTTPRVINATSPNPAFPTLGDVAGGFQVFVNEGFAHLDVLTAEDGPDNNVIGPVSDFLARNIQ